MNTTDVWIRSIIIDTLSMYKFFKDQLKYNFNSMTTNSCIDDSYSDNHNYILIILFYIQGVSGRIVNILTGGSMDYSE